MAQPSGGDRSGQRTSNSAADRDRYGDRNGHHDSDRNGNSRSSTSASALSSRQAAAERLKVNRGVSPERSLSSAQSFNGTKILKRRMCLRRYDGHHCDSYDSTRSLLIPFTSISALAPVKRSAGPKSMFPTTFKSPGMSVNHVRDAGLKAIRDGPIALNTKKRDLRSIEEITEEIREKSNRQQEREKRILAIEEEREKARQQREKALQAAKYSRALMSDDAQETDRLHKEILQDKSSLSKRRNTSRSPSQSRSPSPRARGRKSRSKSPVKPRKRSRSPPYSKKRSYSPEVRRRSGSPDQRRQRSVSPQVKRKLGRDPGDRDRDRDRERERDRDKERDRVRDRERERERDQDRDRDRDRDRGRPANRSGGKMNRDRPTNGAAKRRSPSPRSAPRKRPASPRGNGRGRGPFEDEFSVSNVIGQLFGTRYRARVEDEDLSDDMEARPDEVFREEARRYR